MENFISRQLAILLGKEGIRFEGGQIPQLSVSRLMREEGELVRDVYERLGGLALEAIQNLSIPAYPILIEKKLLVGHGELSFNRYTAAVLRSSFYEKFAGFKTDVYLRYCRQFENNCTKAGTAAGIWTSPLAKQHFGEAEAPGDFFGNGSPGWKLVAFASFLRDIASVREGLQPHHVAVYDQLMVNGRLLAIGELLKSPGSEQYRALIRFLRRMLGLPAATE